MINRMKAIIRKELKSYFNSPIAYIVMGVFLSAMAVLYFFFSGDTATRFADLRGYFNFIPWVFILIIPAITMRTWAEEKKSGTDEVLLTLPFREAELVIGKFVAVFLLLVLMLLLTAVVPISLSALGNFEFGQVIGQYLGVLFYGTACLTVGLFVSALTKNQIIAFLATALILFLLVAVNFLNAVISFPPFLASAINWISFRYHFETLGKGLIELKDLFFFVIMSAFFLFLNVKVLVIKKWL
jgi:ABC-2 type transport system permease protein